MELETLQERIAEVFGRIAAACGRVGRDAEDVTLVAVTKTFGPDAVRMAVDGGLTVLGENRVQEAVQKIPLCPGNLEWHLIGHLQKNKVRHAVRVFSMIHSVDSLELLETVDRVSGESGRVMPVLIQVNVSGERSKFGLSPEGVPDVLERSMTLQNVDVCGLMTIPPIAVDPEASRPFFRKLRGLRDGWREQFGIPLEGLSMGMSGDFEVAVEEGATWVRLGAALFGHRSGKQWKRD